MKKLFKIALDSAQSLGYNLEREGKGYCLWHPDSSVNSYCENIDEVFSELSAIFWELKNGNS